MPLPTRLLTADEVEYVLSAIGNFRVSKKAPIGIDAHTFEALRYNLRRDFSITPVADHPDVVKTLHERLRLRFKCALITPGISDGARAASANNEPIVQSVLKAGQTAGIRDSGSHVGEVLTMAARRSVEYIYTAPNIHAPPPEWYAAAGSNPIPQGSTPLPIDLDGHLAISMASIDPPIEPLIIRAPRPSGPGGPSSGGGRGSVCRTVELQYDPANMHPAFYAMLTEPYPGTSHIFQLVEFSIVEALKLRLTPHAVLTAIRAWLVSEPEGYRGTSPCGAHIYASGAETFGIAIWCADPTVSLNAAHGISEISADSVGLRSFEIIQIPTIRAVTSAEEVDPCTMGLLAPTRLDGAPARVWLLHLGSPISQIPAHHLAIYLHRLGIRILSCDRNAAGRSSLIRVAEWAAPITGDLLKWISVETDRISQREKAPVALLARTGPSIVGRSQGPPGLLDPHSGSSSLQQEGQARAPGVADDEGPILTWRAASPDTISGYSTYRYIKYTGNAKLLHVILANPLYDSRVTYTNLIPEMSRVLGNPVARQSMELEWIQRAASGKVSQLAVDHLTAYGCGSGPYTQALTTSAIGAGGPIAALNTNPNAVLTNAALASRTHQLGGSQANVVTGDTSRINGASSIRVVTASLDEDERGLEPVLRGRGSANAAITDETRVHAAPWLPPPRPTDLPNILRQRLATPTQ
jgi:hypothetical protein